MRSLALALVSLALAAGCSRSLDRRGTEQRARPHPPRDIVAPQAPSVRAPARSGGVRVLQSAHGAVCGDDLAATTFRFAICACEDAAFAADVVTRSYSSSDPSAPVAGGGLGANGSVSAAGSIDVGGSLAAGGGVHPAGSLQVRDDLLAGGDVSFAGAGSVGGDAFVGGDLTALGLSVAGEVHANEDALVLGGDYSVVREPVTVDLPCACGDDARTDVVGIVAAARSDNDNALHAVDPRSLTDVAGDLVLSLPGGRFHFEGVRAAGAVRITTDGPTAVFVDGDLALAGALEVILEGEAASLDLFVAGDLAAAGALDIGSANAPAKVRVYVGGDHDIAIAGEAELGASLFAPEARVALAGSFTFDGALIARNIAHAGTLSVRYDADVLDGAGQDCVDPPGEGDLPADETTGDEPGTNPDGDTGTCPPGTEGCAPGSPGDETGGGTSGDGTSGDGTGAGAGEGAVGDSEGSGDGVGGGGSGEAPGDAVDEPATCDTSADCGNQACLDGLCGACVSDLDCAAPLRCSSGTCLPLIG